MKKLIAILLSVLMLTSCTNKINHSTAVSSLPDLESSKTASSSDIPAITEDKMPLYPVFENTEWGMTPDEVLSTLGLTKSDWTERKDAETEGTRLNFVRENADIYGTKAHVIFVFSTDPKRDIGLIEVRVACISDESIKAIKAQLDEKYGKTEGDSTWKTGNVVADHPKWELLKKAMIKELTELNKTEPEGLQLDVEGAIDLEAKSELAVIKYAPPINKLENQETVGTFRFIGQSAAWANSLQ